MTPTSNKWRKPHAVDPDDPTVELVSEIEAPSPSEDTVVDTTATVPQTSAAVRRGIRWGGLLIAAMAGLAGLAMSLSFAQFVASVVVRDDWIGWTGFGLAAIAGIAFVVLALRELVGLIRLSRLNRLRSAIAKALRDRDVTAERNVVNQLRKLYDSRDDLKWGLARLREHQGDVRDAGELLRLTDRELMAPLDRQAQDLILKSGKRVTVVTAISPMVWIAMLFVVAENLRLIRSLATLYGASPGGVGALRLARMVFTHILATGGLAMTDDLLGQFLGQDLVRRLSRRLGEGLFNGALTARIGTAAVQVTRPVPFLDSEPLRLRDIMRQLVRTSAKTTST